MFKVLGFCPMSFVTVGEEAFLLSEYILRPKTSKISDIPKRVYNYRVIRTRRNVEFAIGILCNKQGFFILRLIIVQISSILQLKFVPNYIISFAKKTASNFRIHYIKVLLRVLRLLALEVLFLERLYTVH